MGSPNGIIDLPSSVGGRSQQHHAKHSSRRPPRACTARTPSRLAPAAPSVERKPSRRQNGRSRSSRSDSDPPFTPMVLNIPVPADQKDRWRLRSMWELASIVNFLNIFRPVLNIKVEFSIDELESALLIPNTLLDAVHIGLLKAIPPISRNPLNHETWVPALCKKMKDRWCRVAEGFFPLAPYHGEENVTYRELDPNARVAILKALCEVRLEQDDVRAFIDEMLKQGTPLSSIRKERIGSDTQGTTYWYENDPVAGQRLYRELRRSDDKDKAKDRGQFATPPTTSQWETLATDLDDFLSVGEKLFASRNRMEIAVGKRINNDIIPDLKELQKKKERALKKQQRQALLLDTYWNAESMTGGRPRRDRKPVTYTFDDYDKSISEAIKITKSGEICPPNFAGPNRRRNMSPEMPTASEKKTSNGTVSKHSEEMDTNSSEDDDEELETSSGVKNDDDTRLGKQHDHAILSSESELPGIKGFGRGRRLRKPQKYAESDYVDPTSENDAGISSEEDIEGEAVYDDDYFSKKRRLAGESSDGDDEYRGDEDEEDIDDEDEDEDDDYFGSSEEETKGWGRRSSKNTTTGRTRAKTKAPEKFQSGLRRSQRATRSHIDYSKYEESDAEDNRMKDARSLERSDIDGAATLANVVDMRSLEPRYGPLKQDWENIDAAEECYDTKDSNQDNLPHRTGKGVYAIEDLQDDEVSHRPANGLDYEPVVDLKPDVEVHRYLDLNVAAPMAGGLEESCSKGFNHSLPNIMEKFENSGDDGSTCGSPKVSSKWRDR